MSQPSASVRFAPLTSTSLMLAVLAMGAVVLASNVLVQYPLNDWLTWGAFSYPVAFLVSNLINRRFGPQAARRVAWAGFALAVVLSIWIASPRIAAASCLAFITAQLLDITVFDRLRAGNWWRAPMVATTCSATVDTAIFWSIAFTGSALPWISWAFGDLAVKLAIGVCLLVPFRALLWKMAPARI
ncbi:queuosine precursor transporter [Stenotrophomonas sp. YIM B06876]|uniref:queuosine precursor transporter n=1 Tax=Stenotrophomonas sp. YIM B06876 TaxID=3060211 RepID=UPI002738F174|nr:queuosine precursor transporter [Stenotrophomonas sp. YIM B06876]